jgi:hypothetical protein
VRTIALSREYELLVRAATPQGHGGGGVAAALASGHGVRGVRWEELVALAERHRLAPLLWRHLSSSPPPADVPREVLERLESAYLASTAGNLLRRARLHEVLGALGAAGVPAMLLKGAALVETVYPEPGLRPMVDLDVLVPAQEIERAHTAVRNLGYVVNPQQTAETHQGMRDRHYHYPSLVARDGMMAVEIHRHVLMGPSAFDISGFWERARPGTGGPAHLLPAPEDLLLHVGIHFSNDRLFWSKGALGQLTDMAWIAACHPLDWDDVVRRAAEYGVGGRLFLALLTARLLVCPDVPESVLEALRPDGYRPELGRRFVEQRVLGSRPWIVPWLNRGGDRPAALASRLVPSPEYLAGRYGAANGASSAAVLRLYAQRVARGGRLAAPYLLRPRQLVTDIRLHRWVRSSGIVPMC